MAQTEPTILWHDYETWGTKPSVDFPVQFAAIRTNLNLEIIEPQPNINWLCKMPLDYLPHPQACLVTGLTPIYSLTKGLSEPEFAKRIYKQISQANTCVAGYNSMNFDEEVTRHLLFRNLYPVYDREYKQNNSRWDIIDLIRACYALRPSGINWPMHQDGKPNFRLESLSSANEVEHEHAHDALSDVYATIAMAKLVKTKQPKLYDYYWGLRNKHKVNELLQQFQNNIFVYVGAYIKSEQGCCTLIMPICPHPNNNNSIICIDLNKPIDTFFQNDPESLSSLLFNKSSNERPGLLNISVNKCPFIAPLKTLNKERADSLNINIEQCIKHFNRLRSIPHLSSLCQQTFVRQSHKIIADNVDQHLYSTDFPSTADIVSMNVIRDKLPEQLAEVQNVFESATLNRLLFRYKARNFPGILNEKEMENWHQHVRSRLMTDNKDACLSAREFSIEVQALLLENQKHPSNLKILQSLNNYVTQLAIS